MAEENVVVAPATPENLPVLAPNAAGTAPPVEAPVSGEVTPETPTEPKLFKQEELDEIVSKRLARERRKWEREQAQRPSQEAPVVEAEPQKPNIGTFQTVEEYDRAMELWSDKRIEVKEAKRAQSEREASVRREAEEVAYTHAEREEKAVEKYADYYQVTRNPQLPITPAMLDAIQVLATGSDVAYHLGKNLQEAARIAQLPAKAQGVEMGMLAAKLALAPPAPKTSSAPAPIVPVGGKGNAAPVIDSTDPRSDKLSTDEWMKLEDARMKKRYAQR